MTPPSSVAAVEDALTRFIVQELLETAHASPDPLAAGEVDSLGVEQLVEYIFEVWRIELDDDDIVEENFESVNALAALVESRR